MIGFATGCKYTHESSENKLGDGAGLEFRFTTDSPNGENYPFFTGSRSRHTEAIDRMGTQALNRTVLTPERPSQAQEGARLQRRRHSSA